MDDVARQLLQLKVVNRLGRALAQQTYLNDLATALARVFTEEFAELGLTVWVRREVGDEVDPVCQTGPLHLPLFHQYTLQSGDEVVGRLDVHAPKDAAGLELVEELVPWVSIALGNARSFTLLREYRDQLTTKVNERAQELNEAMAQLEQAFHRERNAIRRKTEFFDNVSHELRTPLTLILLTLESLQLRSAELPSFTHAHLDQMERSASRLLRLINDLLDLAQIEAGKMRLHYEPVDVPTLLESVLVPFRVAADKKKLQLRLEGAPVEAVHADAEKLDAVFQNLVSNALKFTESGEIALRVSQDEQYVHVEVRDTGIGISPRDQQIIFERFAQSDEQGIRRFGGTGIGLALVKETVELHGGRVSVESEPARGSAFTVSLPRGTKHINEALRDRRATQRQPVVQPRRADEAVVEPLRAGVPPALPAVQPAPAEETSRARVLVVEDDEEIRNILRELLKAAYELSFAEDGEQGLAKVAEAHPDLVLSDVMMPVMSGLQMLAALRAAPATRDLPVILLTARHETNAKVEALNVGANDYVSKPFSPRELMARIDTQLRLREVTARVAQSERLAATSLLTSGFAHEVRNPLNGLMNALSPLREALASHDGELANEMLAIVEEAAARVRNLAETLLSMVRTSAVPQDVDVAASVRTAERALRWKLPATVRLELDASPTTAVLGDAGALTQVWVNLIDNALRAVGPRGRVSVRIWQKERDVMVTVSDDGAGIAPEHLKRLFEPFFSTRASGEGTGLGLALCRRIVSGHGGHIQVESQVGRGTTVTVRLPAGEVTRFATEAKPSSTVA